MRRDIADKKLHHLCLLIPTPAHTVERHVYPAYGARQSPAGLLKLRNTFLILFLRRKAK